MKVVVFASYGGETYYINKTLEEAVELYCGNNPDARREDGAPNCTYFQEFEVQDSFNTDGPGLRSIMSIDGKEL